MITVISARYRAALLPLGPSVILSLPRVSGFAQRVVRARPAEVQFCEEGPIPTSDAGRCGCSGSRTGGRGSARGGLPQGTAAVGGHPLAMNLTSERPSKSASWVQTVALLDCAVA